MLFSSVLFIFLFLPLTLLGYFLLKKPYRNAFLLLASLVFYAWGETHLVLLLIASLVVNYRLSLLVDASIHKRGGLAGSLPPKLLLAAAIICNLLPLFYFKYSNFLVSNLAGIAGPDFTLAKNWEQVVLPLGISFYTFQAMSYVIDVYRGDTAPAASFVYFGAFLACLTSLASNTYNPFLYFRF